nr:hypothetical protein [Tanacetum cinerariifolium]
MKYRQGTSFGKAVNSKESNLSSSTTIVEVPKELRKVGMVNSSLKKLKFYLASFDVTESYAEQAFWSHYSVQTDEPNHFGTTIVEVLKELPKVSMVNSCLKKLKFHLASFDIVVKERTTATAITEDTWGFEHTKACFRNDIIPFMKNLKELFTSFDQCLIDEVTEVQNIFKQMELAVEQHCAEKTKFQTKMENVLKENDQLLTRALSVEIVNIVVHDYENFDGLNVDACVHCVTTESELKTDFIKKECYETLLQRYHILETHCISLEVNNQLNTEIFERDTMSSPESAPTFAELFEINDLKAQIPEKDTVILKLKEKLKSFSGDVKARKVEREEEEIETLKLELDHKSSGKVLVITALKEQLSKLKCKAVLTKVVSLNPIDPALLQIQELLMILQQTCPRITDLGTNLVAVTPKNQTKQVRRVALVSSASGSQSKDNTKKNRIRRTHKKAKETELEDHPRKVKSSLNKESIVDSRASSFVIKSVSNINSVNASRKSKSAKKPVNRKVWKTTCKVFKTVGYIWKPTGRTFTLVGNVCPLTRIATATIVPPKEPIPIVQSADKPFVTLVYTRKPKAKNVPKKMKPNKS